MQAQSQVISSSSALTGKTEEAAAFKTQLEQLRHEFAQQQVTGAASADAVAAQAKAAVQQQLTLEQQQHALTKQRLVLLEAQGQQSSSATALPAQV